MLAAFTTIITSRVQHEVSIEHNDNANRIKGHGLTGLGRLASQH